MNKIQSHQKKAAEFFVVGFSLIILAISATTTFTFFSSYFIQIFPVDLLGSQLARLMAGGAGVILFDLAAVYWLSTFLRHAETSEQRAISGLLLVITFAGAAAASMAQLGLAATGDVALDPATRQSIADISVWTVIAGVVVNFGANIAYSRFSLASKEAVREANRRDSLQKAEDKGNDLLDRELSQLVEQYLSDEVDAIAREQARRIAGQWRRDELTKYADSYSKSAELDQSREVHRPLSVSRQPATNGHHGRGGYRPE